MPGVWDVLELEPLIAEFVGGISRGDLTRIVVRGPSGTGKTTLAETVLNRLAPHGIHLLRLRGDMTRLNQDYYPFLHLLRARSPHFAPREILHAAAEDLPAGTNLIKRAIDLVALFAESRRGVAEPPVHDPLAAEIVATLHGHIQRRQTVLLLDDVQAFDAETMKILEAIIARPNDYLGKHAARLCVLATENSEEVERNRNPVRDRMLARFRVARLSRCERERFPALLQAFGFPDGFEGAVLDNLFLRSGAHLRVLTELARQITSSSGSLDLSARADLLELVLMLRLSEPAAVELDVERILGRVVILGSTFTKIEVQCLLNDVPPSELMGALRKSMELGMLESQGAVICFQHSSIRDFFLRTAPRQQSHYHEIFCTCLRTIRPSDYASRILHLRAAGNDFEADILHVLNWARANRNGRSPDPPVFEVADYAEYVAELGTAHEWMRAGDMSTAVAILEAIHGAYPDELLAERDLTLAECYLEYLEYAAFDRALELLSRLAGRLEEELELRARMLFLSSVGKALKAEYNESNAILDEMMRLLAPVRHTDPGLQRVLNRAQLIGDCTQKIEISGRRIYSALKVMQEAKTAGRPFNPIDLFTALTNFSGNQIITGEYEEATMSAATASALRAEFQEIRFPSPVPALNNHVIADLLGGRATPIEAVSAFEKLLEQVEQPNDRVLVSINHANACALAGEPSRAAELLELVRADLSKKGACDEYYLFYTDHALAVAHLLSGARNRARYLWDLLVPLMTTLPPGLREYLPHRHRLLTAAFADPTVIRPEHWHTYLHDTPLYRGRPWRFFRNGFLFSDIQVWFQF